MSQKIDALDFSESDIDDIEIIESFEELLTKVGKDRDKAAFITLFEHFAPRVKSFLLKGGTNPETAEELMQETMLTMWRKAENYDQNKAAASTWIFTIARNKKIDAFRKTKGVIFDYNEPVIIDDSQTQDAHVNMIQNKSIIKNALKTLPKNQADLIHKSFFEDKTHNEIAAETGIALGTVKSRIRLALQKLKEEKGIKSL